MMFAGMKPSKPGSWPVRFIGLACFLILASTFVFNRSSAQIRPDKHIASSKVSAVKKPIEPIVPLDALDSHINHLKDIAAWKPTKGTKVIGLVFYGRRRFVSILQCYLRRNMVENGGLLEQIIFIAKTSDHEDLAYLDELLASNDKWTAVYHNAEGFDYSKMWDVAEKGNVYVKIDDDVLFIEDSTIRSIVKRKLEHPEYIIVSANLVVQFAFAWIHYHLGAIHPYLPELQPLHTVPTVSWRKSELPYWSGPDDWDIANFTAPPEKHRWLPLAPGTGNTDITPIGETKYMVGGPGWDNWLIGAQQHYSFLENLEKGELWRYAYDMWDVHYDRLSINFMAIMGDDIVAMSPMPRDDEELITQVYSKQTGRHVVVDGHGLAVHNGYWVMSKHDNKPGIDNTDALDRYRAYAEENICAESSAYITR